MAFVSAQFPFVFVLFLGPSRTQLGGTQLFRKCQRTNQCRLQSGKYLKLIKTDPSGYNNLSSIKTDCIQKIHAAKQRTARTKEELRMRSTSARKSQ